MNFFLYSFLPNIINISILIILLLLLEPILKKFFSAACLYYVWVILLIGLLIPVRMKHNVSLFHIILPQFTVENKDTLNSDEPDYYETYYKYMKTYNFSGLPNQTEQNDIQILKGLHFDIQNSYLFLYLIWIIGFIILIIKSIFYIKYQKQLKKYIILINETDINQEVDGCRKEQKYGLNRFIFSFFRSQELTVNKCSVITSPISIGLLKPMILLPDETYPKKDLQFLLMHEIIHICRWDTLVKFLCFFVLSFNWYNPLCYILTRQIDHWCELSCDEKVLMNSGKNDRMHYSKLLLKCASTQITSRDRLLINYYGGKNNMKNRLSSIMNQSKKHSGKILLILIVGIVFTAAFVTINNNKISADTKEVASASNDNTALVITPSPTTVPITTPTIVPTTDGVIDDASKERVANQQGSNGTQSLKDTDSIRKSVVDLALEAKKTTVYTYGGNDLKTGVDCSGFVQAVYKNIGYELPRLSSEQLSSSKEVSFDDLLPGDLIFYGTKEDNSINHVAIYIGENKVIHASNHRDNIRISDINYRPALCAGRIITF